jgi:soluble lytic murein transglycosylase
MRAARGFLAIAALLSCLSAAPAAIGQGNGDPLVYPLTAADIGRYQSAFQHQRAERWDQADRELAQIKDRLLVGHVLAQRYLAQARSAPALLKYADLEIWLTANRDHPGAHEIHRAALRLKPRNARNPAAPTGPDLSEFNGEPVVPAGGRIGPQRRKRSPAEQRTVNQADAAFLRHLRAGQLAPAEKVLERADVQAALSPSEFDDWRRRLATQYFLAGQDQAALRVAEQAARRSRERVPRADWLAGLAAWRLGRYDNAAYHFEQLASSATAGAWEQAAGAYWASRVALKLRQPAEAVRMLERAAEQPRTFYGLLAVNQLGRDLPLDWRAPTLSTADARRLAAIPGVRRAVALSDIGETALAEQELRALRGRSSSNLAAALLGLAERLDAPSALMQLGMAWRDATGEPVDAALYPLPSWEPDGGFQVDRALVFALIRQESAFNPRALSPAGASGLMQLMPRTASSMAGGLARNQRHRLFAPEFNIELGQRYIRHLLDNAPVSGNLFYLAAAYNAGPGNLQKWIKELRFDDDPLLFTETIPLYETRNFVERVVANHWIYRARLGLASPSLDNLTVGNWPLYDGDTPPPANPRITSNGRVN